MHYRSIAWKTVSVSGYFHWVFFFMPAATEQRSQCASPNWEGWCAISCSNCVHGSVSTYWEDSLPLLKEEHLMVLPATAAVCFSVITMSCDLLLSFSWFLTSQIFYSITYYFCYTQHSSASHQNRNDKETYLIEGLNVPACMYVCYFDARTPWCTEYGYNMETGGLWVETGRRGLRQWPLKLSLTYTDLIFICPHKQATQWHKPFLCQWHLKFPKGPLSCLIWPGMFPLCASHVGFPTCSYIS